MTTILLLSGGSLVGQNILAALYGRRQNVKLIATNSKSDEPSLFLYDKVYLCPTLTTHPSEFEDVFLGILNNESPDLIVPCRDEDVYFLAKFGEKFPEYKYKLLCGNKMVADALVDKEKSANLCDKMRIPFAKTILADSQRNALNTFMDGFSFPIVAKPVRGFASQGVYLILNSDQMEYFIGKKDYIFQHYVGNSSQISEYMESVRLLGLPLYHSFEQTKVSIQGNISPDGSILGTFITLHQMMNGKSDKVSISNQTDWLSQSDEWTSVFSENGWRGPINIQCQIDENNQLCAYELNGRFTGATHARLLLGFDELKLTLEAWCGMKIQVQNLKNRPEIVRKTMQNTFLDIEQCHLLSESGTWP